MVKRKIEDWALFGGSKTFAAVRTTMNLFPPDERMFFEHMRGSFREVRLSNNGPSLLELESRLANFHEVRHCVAFSSGFTAMYIAVRNLGLIGKREVILPSLTYRKMADIIQWAGFTPHFCDVEEATLGPSRATVETCLNGNTAMILAAHPRTRLCAIDDLEELSRESGIPLMFDSVEACGATHNGKMLGGFGDCEAFSMHADKLINGAEGGYITTNDDELARTLRLARAFGFDGPDNIVCLGTNAKLNELHAAVALASLAKHEEHVEGNRALHFAYQESLADIPGVDVIEYDRNEKRNWRSFLVRLGPDWPLSRQQTLELLNAENIFARPYYSPPQHKTFSGGICAPKLPVTERVAENHLILPVGATVSPEDARTTGQLVRAMHEQGALLRERMAVHEKTD